MERVADAAPRKWLDKTEKHETIAKYVGSSADAVRLEKANGKVITISLDKLSDVNRSYVKVKRSLEEEEKRGREVKKSDPKVEMEMKMAAECLAAGRVDDAASHYRTALQMKPDLAEADNGLGQVAAKKGRMDEAIQHFEDGATDQSGPRGIARQPRTGLGEKGTVGRGCGSIPRGNANQSELRGGAQ